MDVPNVGWWVPVLIIAVPLLLLLSLHLLARLESWMFSPDERADRVARLLEESDTPDEVEQEVARMLAEVTDKPVASGNGRVSAAEEPGMLSPSRVDRSAMQNGSLRRLRLKRAIGRSRAPSERGPS